VTKRQYQLFALLLLIGAPLTVSLLSGYFLPGLRQIAPGHVPAPAAPEYMQPAANPADSLPPAMPPPPAGQPMQSGPQAGSAYDAAPSFNPSGVAIAGTDPMPASGQSAAASAPTAEVPPANANPLGLSREDIAAIRDEH
jgi:hypothetical protein